MDHANHTRLTHDELTEAVLDGATVYGPGDETVGSVIVYNSGNDTFSVDGGPGSRTASNPSGRVRAMFTPVPKAEAPAAPAASPAPLKPSGQLGEGRP